MVTVNASIRDSHYATEITTGTNQLIADEPIGSGGKDAGFSPGELLAGALASCICITLRMYADRKGWPMDEAKVKVTYTRDAAATSSSFETVIEFVGDLTQEQKERLMQIADQCPLHRAFSNPITMQTTLL